MLFTKLVRCDIIKLGDSMISKTKRKEMLKLLENKQNFINFIEKSQEKQNKFNDMIKDCANVIEECAYFHNNYEEILNNCASEFGEDYNEFRQKMGIVNANYKKCYEKMRKKSVDISEFGLEIKKDFHFLVEMYDEYGLRKEGFSEFFAGVYSNMVTGDQRLEEFLEELEGTTKKVKNDYVLDMDNYRQREDAFRVSVMSK